MSELCLLFGRSKQAYYKYYKVKFKKECDAGYVLEKVQEFRKDQPRLGGRKLFHLVQKDLPEGTFLMGRDAFFNLLRQSGYLLRQHKVRVRTTDSRFYCNKFPNLAAGFVPTGSGQLYVSDITYIRNQQGNFYYLSLITDAYCRKIVGWDLSSTMVVHGCLKALEMALNDHPVKPGLIHHSDRGSQYNAKKYLKLLQKNHIKVSMTQSGDPLENALAERVNGILKMEWLNQAYFSNIYQARKKVERVIYIYNNCRPHLSLNMLTPQQGYAGDKVHKRLWKNYYPKPKNSSLGERPGGKGREHPSRRAEKITK